MILSLIAFRIVSSMPAQDFWSWGWRAPFLASAVLLLVGLVIRLGVAESPAFEQMKLEHKTVKLPIAVVVRDEWRTVLLCL